MAALTSGQRKYLRKLAHDLKAQVQIGKNGLSEQALQTIDNALNAHELIKIKFLDFQDQKHELAQEIEDKLHGERVGLIGNVLTVYRESRDPDKRTIKLPASE